MWELFLATSSILPRRAKPWLAGGSGTLSNGLAAEEVEGEGAEEGWDAVLAQQVEFDQLADGAWELRLQKLHFATQGAGGLMGKKNKPVNTRGFQFTSCDTGGVSPWSLLWHGSTCHQGHAICLAHGIPECCIPMSPLGTPVSLPWWQMWCWGDEGFGPSWKEPVLPAQSRTHQSHCHQHHPGWQELCTGFFSPWKHLFLQSHHFCRRKQTCS